jgi:hypothetical protein
MKRRKDSKIAPGFWSDISQIKKWNNHNQSKKKANFNKNATRKT